MIRILLALTAVTLAWPVLASDVGIRIRFGLTDTEPARWDGSVSVSPGRIERIDGWRFQDGDQVLGANGWKASTRPLTVRRSNNPKKTARGRGRGGNLADNGVLLLLTGVTDSSVVQVKTARGSFDFKLADIAYGRFLEKLNGAVDLERVAASRPLTAARTDDDYPALAVADDGTAYAVWISFTPGLDRDERARSWDKAPEDLSFLAKPPGGDRLWLRVQTNGVWSEPLAVTSGGGDLYKCAVAVDGKGAAWIFWSENRNWPKDAPANFEIRARSLAGGKWSEPVNLSGHAGNDVSLVATTDAAGRVWVAWQGARDHGFQILERHQLADGDWSAERVVSTQRDNCWTPAIAATARGTAGRSTPGASAPPENAGPSSGPAETAAARGAARPKVAIAWDTYEKGDYDVWVREFGPDGTADAARPAANSDKYEARPALTYDHEGRLWISYELSGPTWGKDWGGLVRDKGIGLYRDRQIGLRVLADGRWLEPVDSFADVLPGAQKRRGPANLPVRVPEPEATPRRPGEEAQAPGQTYNNMARIVCDRDGRVWLFARSREGTFHTPLGSVWMNYAAYYEGQRWVGPILLPHSDNLIYNLPAVAAHPWGGLLVVNSTDHRQDRHLVRRADGGGNSSLGSDRDPFDNDIYANRLEFPEQPVKLTLVAAKGNQPLANPAPTAATLKERAEVARCRAQRLNYNGTELRLVRGEFHRHTEISGDGGNDGPLEDMWRYGIDVAAMDWLGCGDHDNGGGREYTWWLTQKTTDAFRLPGRFDPPFSYERSVRYPEGHRNVVFTQRGVRTLPRLPKTQPEPVVHAPDTQMLYRYLRQFHGVCASHTSATDMGTDWRDNDPEVEPMVEIYQGARQNYERPGAPRAPTESDAFGGWRPLGFVNLALLKGYRFSFESSSDHGSTHISYAMVYARGTSREDLLQAMRARHTYAATDNIIAEWRGAANGRDYLMGDEFKTSQPPGFRLKLHGTGAFQKVTIIKDDAEVHVVEPGQPIVELTWTDPKPVAGKTSYYYVRGEQADGELVWVSPMWVTYEPGK
jgi:hypothetical protein